MSPPINSKAKITYAAAKKNKTKPASKKQNNNSRDQVEEIPSPESMAQDESVNENTDDIDSVKVFSFLNDDESLYEFFGVPKDASEDEIKKRYRKFALTFHPDRHPNKPQTDLESYKLKFQQYSIVYEVIGNKEKRARYDRTGCISDSFLEDVSDFESYFKSLYHSLVTPESIEKFKKEYQGSEEEKKDLVKSYLDNFGAMSLIMEEIPCSTVQEDETRFRQILLDLICKKEIESFDVFVNEPEELQEARLQAALDEEKEAEEAAIELGIDFSGKSDEDSNKQLQAIIAGRQKKREENSDAFLDSLAAKYGKKNKIKRSNNDENVVESTIVESEFKVVAPVSKRGRKPKNSTNGIDSAKVISKKDNSNVQQPALRRSSRISTINATLADKARVEMEKSAKQAALLTAKKEKATKKQLESISPKSKKPKTSSDSVTNGSNGNNNEDENIKKKTGPGRKKRQVPEDNERESNLKNEPESGEMKKASVEKKSKKRRVE